MTINWTRLFQCINMSLSFIRIATVLNRAKDIDEMAGMSMYEFTDKVNV